MDAAGARALAARIAEEEERRKRPGYPLADRCRRCGAADRVFRHGDSLWCATCIHGALGAGL